LRAGEKEFVLKKALTITVVAGALAATLTFVAAGSLRRDQATATDAQLRDTVSISPPRAANAAYAQAYDNSPRIIHVPQAGERIDGARAATRARASVPADESATAVAEPPPQPKAPPPRPRRTVLSAPPQDGLTPVHPTPRWHSTVEEFGNPPPRAPALNGPRPPVGYSPPAALPHSE
jgi:hypothetical protein